MDVVAPFAAALVALRLAGLLVRRHRERPAPEWPLWAAALAAFAVASGALTWGAAAGWDDRSFRVYYLCGGLLTAALLGLGSLAQAGWRRATALALVWVGLSVGLALAVPLDPSVSGDAIPEPGDHLNLLPARMFAVAANIAGTLAAAAVALRGLRRRPLGNALVLGGLAAAAAGSTVAGLGEGPGGAFALVAALLLYGGFIARR
ncbi:MAG: hypothetical protein EXQ77_05595 [Thermoleophilia bacterium]|nr:hypothetical protein [Thermoleophilia bacterium]